MSKITGKEYPISDIFTSKFEYHIPSYQRPYAWEKEQAETLFDDLLDFYKNQPEDDNYFLGSIVLIKEDDENKPYSDVIDGQQRLTSLTILLSVIASVINDVKLRTKVEKYLYEDGDELIGLAPQPRLFLRPKEKDFFRYFIQEVRINELLSLKPDNPMFDTEAKRHIRINCQAFIDRLKQYFESESDEFKKFVGFILKRCYLISVMTPSQTSAFRVFSVMNSRGLDLLPIDIFKADIIGEIPVNLQNMYTQKWEDMENDLTRQGFNELFVHIRMIYAKEKLREELVTNFKKTVKSKIVKSEDFIDKVLTPYCKHYNTIRRCDYTATSDTTKRKSINDTLGWLNKGFNYDWIPATLRFMLNHSDDSDYLLWFLKKMERLAVCMMVTGKDVNKRINRYCQILNEMGERPFHSITSPLLTVELTDEEKDSFVSVLGGDVYHMTSRYRNYIIQRLDSFVSDGAATYDEKVFTIEHVLPQTVNPQSEWNQLWPDEKKRADWLHKIANLVPLARRVNSAAQNYDFDEKKDKYFRNSRTGTTSYNLTTQVLAEPIWSEIVVEKRQKELLDIFKEKWEL
ncbi:MAG: DUF262 domain-containing protein [Prevotella sp.]|nr:DUF262 domain-containing protein [Prevotella sp.]